MNTSPSLVNALVNDSTFVKALVDNGCLCSGIIDDKLTSRLKLQRFPISPRTLETAEESTVGKPIVKNIKTISIDLDGFVTPKLWLYAVPYSTYQLILGKKWLEDQDAIIYVREHCLDLGKLGDLVYSVK